MYDYVIVGAGSAGCVLAGRLTEDPGTRVLLLEAGPPDDADEIRIPGATPTLWQGPFAWDDATTPQPDAAGRSVFWPHGRTLGGSSSINGMVYIRGNRVDYDAWRDRYGCAGWGYADLLPYFRRAEDQQRGESPFHGVGGPLRVEDPRYLHPLSQAWVEAATAAGLAANPDFNGPTQDGVGLYQATQRGGRRWSAADAYLRPASGRPNLTVETDALATRVLIEHGRAVGVRYLRRGVEQEARAGREVLLCGGAVNSPQLLLLSGIGPADHLRAHGIEPVLDAPRVGLGLQDHPTCFMVWHTPTTPHPLEEATPDNLALWRRERRGPMASHGVEAGGFARSHDSLPAPDLQFGVAGGPPPVPELADPTRRAASMIVVAVDPRSRGRVFQVQRDGAQVPRRLHRRPSHLTDRRATVYATPVFEGDGGDVPAAPLRAIGGPVDVEGGWFDAGDFVKFTHATAYSVAELLVVQRGLHRRDRALAAETRHGLRWLDKVWDARHRVLYAQVGLGTGSERFGFLGDHDVWRLPEADDALAVRPGDAEYFIKYRPVFRAAPPGARISPNLAGRVAAAFALGAQVEGHRDRRRARALLRAGASVFAMARTIRVGELVTAFPHAYYPEDSWQDDMEFGAVELALAARRLHDRRAAGWLRAATHWARRYLGSEHRDALNLYDTSALAHADLVRALRRTRRGPGLELGPRELVADLRRQLDSGAVPARREPFGSAVDVTQFDAATRTFGYAATARLYRRLTGERAYDAFGTAQRNWALGANAWGTSFVIGEGAVFPHCPQHQVANLAGSLTGGRHVLVGAVVNGPNGAENFEDLGIPDGARACPVDGRNRYAAFDRPDARFLDDVRAWPSVEPAIDFTSTGMLAFALAAAR